jgi:hypothetical protein
MRHIKDTKEYLSELTIHLKKFLLQNFLINLFCFIYCFVVVMYPFEGPFAPLMSIKKFASFLLGEQTISEKIILSRDLCLVIDDHLFFRDSYKK